MEGAVSATPGPSSSIRGRTPSEDNVLRRATEELEDIELQLNSYQAAGVPQTRAPSLSKTVNRSTTDSNNGLQTRNSTHKMESYPSHPSRTTIQPNTSGGGNFGYSKVWRTEDTTIGIGSDYQGESTVNVNVRRSPPQSQREPASYSAYPSPMKHTNQGQEWGPNGRRGDDPNLSRESNALRESALSGEHLDIATLSGSGSLSAGHSKAILNALRALQEKIRRLEEEKQMMQRYADDYHNLAEEFKAYRNRAEENEQNMQNSLEGEKSRLNTNISSLERERNNLRDELESKRKDIENLEEENSRLRHELNEMYAKYRETLEKHESTVNDLASTRDERHRLEGKISHLQEQLEESKRREQASNEAYAELADKYHDMTEFNRTVVSNLPGSPQKQRKKGSQKQGKNGSTAKRPRGRAKKKKATTRSFISDGAQQPPSREGRSLSSSSHRAKSSSKNVYDRLKNFYGKDFPFLLGTNAGATHSLIGNVQLSLGDKRACGYRAPPPPNRGTTRSRSNSSSHRSKQNVHSIRSHVHEPSDWQEDAVSDGGEHSDSEVQENVENASPRLSTSERARKPRGNRRTLSPEVAYRSSEEVDKVIQALENEYYTLEDRYNNLMDRISDLKHKDSDNQEARENEKLSNALQELVDLMRAKGEQLELLKQMKDDIINSSERSPIRDPQATRRRSEAMRLFHQLRDIASQSNPWLLHPEKLQSRHSHSGKQG